MNRIQDLHQAAMALAEQADIAKLRGESTATVQALLRSAFEQESAAAELTVTLEARSPQDLPHPSHPHAHHLTITAQQITLS